MNQLVRWTDWLDESTSWTRWTEMVSSQHGEELHVTSMMVEVQWNRRIWKFQNIAHWRFFSGETVSKEAGEAAPRGLWGQHQIKIELNFLWHGQQVDSKWAANVLESTRSGCRFQAGQRSNLFTNRLAYQQARLTTGTFSNRLIYILAD